MPLSYTIKGIEPNGLSIYPDAVRLMYWSWVVELGLKAKDRDLSEGLDAFGEPLRPISKETRKHRISAMTPSGKGDPSAPPLSPGHKLSRVRSLLAGRALIDRAEFWWRFDPFSHGTFARILTYQAEDQGRDVFGLSPESTEEVRMQALRRWRTWLTTGQAVPAELVGKRVVAPLAATGTTGPFPITTEYGHAPTKFAVFGLGGEPGTGAPIRGFSEKEFKEFYRQPGPANVQARPGTDYNRLLRHIWGAPPARGRGRGVTVPKPRPPKQKAPVATPPKPYTLETHGDIPDDLRQNHEAVIREIPSPVLETLNAKGVKFVYAEKLSDKYPYLANVQPSGWPAGTTWDNADGLYNTAFKEIVVTRKRKVIGSNQYETSGRQGGVLFHETGHGLDHALDYPSKAKEWQDAHANDVANLSDEQKAKVAYQLQPGNRGWEEAFAELFANELGDRSGSKDIRSYFPECLALLQSIIAGL